MHTSYMYTYIFYKMADAAWYWGVYEKADLHRFQLRLPYKNAEALLLSKFRAAETERHKQTDLYYFILKISVEWVTFQSA